MSGKNLISSCISIMESSPIYKDKLMPYFENTNKEYKKVKKTITYAYIVIVALLIIIIILLYKICKVLS